MNIKIEKNGNEDLTIYVNDVQVYGRDKKLHIAEWFETYQGVQEYDGIVADIQKWFYGRLVKAAWCATAMSYFAAKAGVLDAIGGKNENVYQMYLAAKKTNKGRMFERNDIPDVIERNDICFFLWDGVEMNTTSKKHVAVCVLTTNSTMLHCLGGNQHNGINDEYYDKGKLYAVYRL